MKIEDKKRAIDLRKRGCSYTEILQLIPVARSTLSVWLRSVHLSQQQKQRLTLKRKQAALRGALKRKKDRIYLTERIINAARKQIDSINHRELWLMGIVLYWAEGSKAKNTNTSQGVIFANSDPRMIKLFLLWLENSIQIPRAQIYFDIYLHENYRNNEKRIIEFWSMVTGFLPKKFDRIYLKKNKSLTNRKNTGIDYYGLVRVRVKKSTNLNRKITGWVQGICQQCGVV